ncbi:GNAT family N-acetyltransferase [Pseudosulfitobacter koreensis]|uniref:L-ornithine N(alpha)-acyltransferase n=1 Tax=Pseudosulfitobacter koreensis TaxID=2968472 RepID=A0ABT1YXB1_9RHOB|nr:GNAT family N-acyltransferase [Pseudosulfitobacter koreense]MCR8825519.1 GNAT family N-acetyltransferase [Pseudosulfitobacter koreense]
MISFERGRYSVSAGTGAEAVAEAQALRAVCFGRARDVDDFDAACTHILIHETASGRLVACFRMLPLSGAEIAQSYSAQFYNLDALARFAGKMVEMGRFCVDPAVTDPDVLRVAWGAMTAYVDREEIELLFGCSSFAGTDAGAYLDAFALLRDRHLAPPRWRPGVKAADVFRFADEVARKPDPKRAMQHMPPLLKTYLLMGGWVSDHAVIDRDMNTLHVFTGVEIGAIPPARKKLLRSVAG